MMAKRSSTRRSARRNVGDVLSIPLPSGQFAFALVLPEPQVAFIDYCSREPTPPSAAIMANPIAFRIWVMNHAITRGTWRVIGHVDVPAPLLALPEFFKQDPISGKLTATRTGAEERPATLQECETLERAAVWDPEHVVERLVDHFEGRPNKWAEAMRPKLR